MKKYYSWMAVLSLLWLVLICAFLTVAPDRVPVHFGTNGEVDRWGSKYEFLLFTGIGIVITWMPILGLKFGWKGMADNEKVLTVTSLCLSVFFLLIFGFFMWKALDPDTLVNGLDQLSMKGVMLLMMVLFIVLGNMMPKASRNSHFGLRIKWSQYNDTCWQKSQRVAGIAMTACGVLGLLLCALLPGTWALWAPLMLLGAAIFVSLAVSYRIYKQEISKQ